MDDNAFFRRTVLIVDDEPINREMLGAILGGDYEILHAGDGAEAMRMIGDYGMTLSLILLDLLMPIMDGYEVLQKLSEDETLKRIPVIVLTSEKSAEVKSLGLGAVDFIPKPYDMPEIIRARVQRTIQLAEDAALIKSMENDDLTGLYTGRFFFEYANRIEQYDSGRDMDAIVVNINNFHLINDLHGRDTGDEMLRSLADNLMTELGSRMGVACRENSDNFYLYVQHLDDYATFLESIVTRMRRTEGIKNLHIRMGVYPSVDHNVAMETRFVRARHACNAIRGDLSQSVAVYNEDMHRRDAFSHQLLEDFEDALAQGQFLIHYQPKYDISGEIPTLVGAEALVRWQHPEFGMISPKDFVPLLETYCLISKLDRYVWNEAIAQIQSWKASLGVALPVSLNISRIDIHDYALKDTLLAMVREHNIAPQDCVLEITESAYAGDAARIVETVADLRNEGFRVEMDDFGSGSSSLNMLADLPLDAIKLDIHLINDMLGNCRSLQVVKLIRGIAKLLSLPLIAEGVEDKEQYDLLKSLNCDIIQGYYFARPMPADEFSTLLHKGD
ncbi:MAG: EAL domain-containing protein [Desulfovibrio sp.]|nr:EAL domain-containing protein [Desulfovibrio sp.]